MWPRRRFQPSESWRLEDRVVLNATAEVSAHAVASAVIGTFKGSYTTTTQFGVDTESAVAQLTGSSTLPHIGAVSLSGSLANNIVFPRLRSHTRGTLTVVGSNGQSGTLVLSVSGPYENLAPTQPEIIHLSVTVKSATGAFARYAGAHGRAILDLVPSGPTAGTGMLSQTHTSQGNFRLVLARA